MTCRKPATAPRVYSNGSVAPLRPPRLFLIWGGSTAGCIRSGSMRHWRSTTSTASATTRPRSIVCCCLDRLMRLPFSYRNPSDLTPVEDEDGEDQKDRRVDDRVDDVL